MAGTLFGFVLIVAYPLWLVLCPQQAVRFYRWFGRRNRIDQRRLDAFTPRAFRISGAIGLGILLLIILSTSE